MKKEFINKYLNEHVAVGVKSARGRPFFFFGKILKISDDDLFLELTGGNGFKIIKLSLIVDVHLDKKYQIEKKNEMKHGDGY